MADIRPLPGFREFYPEDRAIQNHLFTVWRRACRRYGFHEWESPVLEPLELFTEKSGEEIVKQLFNFEDKGGRQVSLRPEMTPSLARMVGARANGMPKPIRWFSIGENFRYEKPQKGRLRSFYQLNADLLGEPSATADAELIALCADCLLGFGLTQKDFSIRISDRQLWFQFLESQKIPNEKITAVLSVVDKLERSSAEDLQTAIKTVLTVNDSSAQELLASIKTFAAIRSLNDLEQFAQKDSASGQAFDGLENFTQFTQIIRFF
jgi:histidyl-tRNA synthetase